MVGILENGMTLVGVGRRSRSGPNFEAVRTAIGTALRSLHSNVLQKPLPDRIVELLGQLDQRLWQLDRTTRRRNVCNCCGALAILQSPNGANRFAGRPDECGRRYKSRHNRNSI
jgi:hypothetical protein